MRYALTLLLLLHIFPPAVVCAEEAGGDDITQEGEYVVEGKKIEPYAPPSPLPECDELGTSIGVLPISYSFIDGRTLWSVQALEFRRMGRILSLEGKLAFSLERQWSRSGGGYTLYFWEGYCWWKLPFFWGSKLFWGAGLGLNRYIGYDRKWVSLWWGMSRAWVITLKGSFVELVVGHELRRQTSPLGENYGYIMFGVGVDFRLTDHLALVCEERPTMEIYPSFEMSTTTTLGMRWYF